MFLESESAAFKHSAWGSKIPRTEKAWSRWPHLDFSCCFQNLGINNTGPRSTLVLGHTKQKPYYVWSEFCGPELGPFPDGGRRMVRGRATLGHPANGTPRAFQAEYFLMNPKAAMKGKRTSRGERISLVKKCWRGVLGLFLIVLIPVGRIPFIFSCCTFSQREDRCCPWFVGIWDFVKLEPKGPIPFFILLSGNCQRRGERSERVGTTSSLQGPGDEIPGSHWGTTETAAHRGKSQLSRALSTRTRSPALCRPHSDFCFSGKPSHLMCLL